MNQNVLLKKFFIVFVCFHFLSIGSASSQSCDNWLSLPSQGSKITIGDVDVSGNKLTVEAMFNRTATLNNGLYYGHLVSKHTDQINVNYALLPNGCEITTSVSGYKAIFQTCVPELNKTYHVAMVYDGSTLKFYRNGFLMSQVVCSGNIVNNDLSTTIAQLAGGADPVINQFLGYVNEVRIWKVARSQSQLQAYMDKPLPAPSTQTGLVAYYSFDNLLNKQGNIAFNGNLSGAANSGTTNAACSLTPSACNTVTDVQVAFTMPDTVCVNTPVNISNISLNATSSYWNFCVADPNKTPTAVNLGNPGGSLSLPVFTDIVYDNGNYYVFLVNYYPGGLVRLDFGNSLLNTPTSVNFGNFGNIIPDLSEGIQVVKDENKWYAIIVGGNPATDGSRIIKVDFGANINNPSPVATNWGNIGDLYHPMELHLFKEGNNWYGLTVNSENSTITRLSFGNGFDNLPTGVNLGNIGSLDHPGGINVISDNGYWRAFTTNATSNTITRLDFGTSMTNIPTGTNLGNPGGALKDPRDIYVMKECGETIAFIINGQPDAGLLKLDFNNDFSSIPAIVNFGNLGNMNFPHSISQLFRAGNDLYCFVPNAGNNTITRVRFTGCTNSSIPNSSLQNPPPITYTTPGTYNISLTIDEGLPTQSSVCKQIVVKDCTIPVVPDFDIPDTVCVNTPVQVSNKTNGATSHFWNFNVADIKAVPDAENLGNPGGNLSAPVFMDYVEYNGNWYGFLINHEPGTLIRLDFGNSLLNTPTSVNLGNFGGAIPPGPGAEGIQMVFNEGKWNAIIVGGYTLIGSEPRIIKIDFGPNLLNPAPVVTNWGNIGNLLLPVDLHVFKEGNNWYGFTVNAENNTIVRFNFSNSFDNTPTAINLGNIGDFDFPTGIYAINDNNDWKVFVLNRSKTNKFSITRLDFGSSLLNTPTAVNLGNPGNLLKQPRDFTVMKFCGQIIGFVVNEQTSDIVRLDFGNDLSAVPTATSLGNIGQLNFPHSISRFFRVGADVYSFITNVQNNTITRLKFNGSSGSSIPNSTLENPPPVTYTTAGIYNVNLTIDDGLPTQASVCKQIVVKECNDSLIINDYTPILSFDPCKNILNVEDASKFNVGDTVLMIQMKGAVIDSTNTASFGTVTNYHNAGNYEFNYIKAKNGNVIELLNVIERQYDIPLGKVQLITVPYFQNLSTDKKLTCLPWDGVKGGVLVFNVQNNLTLNRDIDVSSKGFRGGTAISNPLFTCNITGFFTSNNDGSIGARKGEGIFNTNTLLSGRGKLANGGGGGNSTNSGGAGGGNGGIGGSGGNQYIGCGSSNFQNGGIPGSFLSYSNALNKIFLGGGGGAGHQNDIPALGSGGNGGAIVIITCNTLDANGFSIKANGETPIHMTGTNDDGRSGGGAGGTVLLNYNNVAGDIPISVKGGDGDYCAPPALDIHGPGGGGGGGIVWINKAAVDASLNTDVTGGKNGTNININNDAWGAAPGASGKLLTGLVLPVADILFKKNIDSIRINKTATSCSSFDFKGLAYVNNYTIANWEWNFGDNGTAFTQNSNHTYTSPGNYIIKLVVTDVNGCKDSITSEVNVTGLNFDFDYKQDVCNPLAVQYSGLGNLLNNSFWDFGDGNTVLGNSNPIHTYSAPGNYLVKFSVGNNGCTDTVRKTISINVLKENIILTNDTTICYGSTKQLLTVPSLSFCWSPLTYLDNPNSSNPVTSSPQDITYYFTAEVAGTNLIANGNFSAGNSGFTSQYNFASSNVTEGQYFVGPNPRNWNSSLSACKDHTTGTGNMMLVNGSPVADVNVWKQTVNVTPNTNYAFSTWIQALWTPNPAQLQFSINGKDAGSLITASLPTCTWTQFHTTWNSGNNTTAVISIVNKNTQVQGNDFALDDISFAPVFIKRDSVKIKVEKPSVQANIDTTICTGKSAQLNATGAENYVWSPATGLSATAIANPIASPVVSTEYIVTGTSVNGCSAKDTVHINIYAKPAIAVSADTLICKNALAQLSVTGGVTYSWSPAATLNDPLAANPVASPLVNTRYYVTITDANTCEHLDSVQVAVRPDAVFSINNPQPVCRLDSAQLIASGGDIYNWQPADGLSNASISNPKASPAVTTDYSVTITENTCNQSETLLAKVTVKSLPIVDAAKANDIDCRNDRSQLNATGADQYVWTPQATLSNPGIANPVAKPETATAYIVTGTVNGCSAKDTVVVNVYTKPAIVISSDTTICKNARAQLSVAGGVSYNWSPAATLNNQFIANPVASPLVNTKYYVAIKDANACEYLDSVEVSIRPDAVFSINAPGKVCLFDSVQLNAAGGDIYAWQPAEGLDNIAVSNPWVSPSVTADYKVTITETTCNQSATLSTRLTVMPLPTVNAMKTTDIDCSNDRSQLNVTGAIQYEWTPATTLNNPGIANPVATPATTTAYVVKGTDLQGCNGYDTITVKVDNINKGGYLMPNAFTPNKDGLNDCFGVKYWGVIEKFEFSIYNRWGERIFTTKNPGQCWDGTYKGVEQDGGVYVYMIKAKTICEAEVFRKGTLVLVR